MNEYLLNMIKYIHLHLKPTLEALLLGSRSRRGGLPFPLGCNILLEVFISAIRQEKTTEAQSETPAL